MVDFSVMIDPVTLIAVGGTILLIALLFWLIAYIYIAIALSVLAKKTKTPNGWLAWIPIANFYLVTQIAKVSGLWTLALLAGFIPIVGGWFLLGVCIWLFWRIAEMRKLPGWISILMIVPIVNLIVLGILAWSK